MELESLCHETIGAAIEVHRNLGPGLLEGLYAEALSYELQERGISVAREVEIPVVYKTTALTKKLRIDMLVGEALITEIKSVHQIAPIHLAQLLIYLRLADRKLGLLLNFNVERMQQGIKRVANKL